MGIMCQRYLSINACVQNADLMRERKAQKGGRGSHDAACFWHSTLIADTIHIRISLLSRVSPSRFAHPETESTLLLSYKVIILSSSMGLATAT